MTQSEAILEYIDGTLDHDAEQRLFDALARQPDLRSALRQFISIGQAVHADREAYAPPAHVEQSLLSGLGIPPIAANTAAGAAGVGLMAWLGLSGWRIWGMVASFVLGALLAGSTVYMVSGKTQEVVVNGSNGTNGAGNVTAGSTTGTLPSNGAIAQGQTAGAPMGNGAASGGVTIDGANAPAGNVPQVASPQAGSSGSAGTATGSAGGERRGGGAGAGKDMARNISGRSAPFQFNQSNINVRSSSGAGNRRGPRSTGIASNGGGSGSSSNGAVPIVNDRNGGTQNTSSESRPSESVPSGEDAGAKGALVTRASLRNIPTTISPASSASFAPSRSPEALPSPSVIALDGESADGDRATVLGELRGKGGASLNPTNALDGSSGLSSVLENVALGGYWQLGTHFALGMEGGLEAYDQILHFTSGDTAKVEQRPRYFWGGLAARYYFGTIGSIGVEPFAQGTLGGTGAGPLGRLRLGVRHDFSGGRNDFAISGGVEASGLAYTSNGNPALSGRWGATIGMEMRLW